MSFPRYPAYKPSGVEWLGEVPQHWEVKPLKRVAEIQTGLAKGKEVEPEGSVEVPFLRVANVQDNFLDLENVHMITIQESSLSRYLLRPGDVLMNEGGDFDKLGRGCIWDGMINPCIHQNHVFAVRPHSIRPSWLNAYTSSKQANSYFISRSKQSTNLASISSSNLMDLLVPIAPNSETEEILSFLDRETTKIDTLIAEQQRLIELLQEKRQAVISHAVTKGLNPTAPMKDSGVEWLGEVPEHWALKKIKHTARMESGHTPDRKVEAYWVNCDIPWASLNDTSFLKDNDYISETTHSINELGIQNSSARLLPERVVVFSRDATIGRCAITTRPMAVSQHFIAWVCGEEILPEYLLLRLKSMTQELERLTFGATLKTIGMPDVKTLVTPVPPLGEQEEIVEYVAQSVGTLEEMSTKTRKAVELLQERRSALISAAVTGQIDVRGLAQEEEP